MPTLTLVEEKVITKRNYVCCSNDYFSKCKQSYRRNETRSLVDRLIEAFISKNKDIIIESCNKLKKKCVN